MLAHDGVSEFVDGIYRRNLSTKNILQKRERERERERFFFFKEKKNNNRYSAVIFNHSENHIKSQKHEQAHFVADGGDGRRVKDANERLSPKHWSHEARLQHIPTRNI